MQGLALNAPGLQRDPQWFKTAVFYEVLVRAFADSSGSGAGDFGGLINRLDYLEWLGVDALWIPPFYASPLRDGGYDIADYTAVLPEFGTLPDFEELVSQAHARGLRIITDLVMNHTSDQHVWFQESRRDPTGPYGDYFVWSDDDTKYADSRIIFVDTEVSNWTFDSVRRQFYWHRFFSHQPDLNFENPAVQEEMFNVVRFWADRGIDGFRLDAIPYLFEEEGHNGENHPRTHEFIAKLRALLDTEYPGRLFIAEANQPPRDVVDYFGTEAAPECQMCFHFPVMPMLYYALREQKAAPIIDVLADTPPIPQGAQWGTFLRNHDELTLEMVTPAQRAAMYGWYAPDPRMRANVGIRRRLAPLLDNSRAEIELIHALLLSLPGSPCLYYGDEIGMGDNIWLYDRDAVRTPMQWTPDRNAGFSTADPGKLHLPVITSLVFHHNNVNVEAQMAISSSLLQWVRAMLTVRKAHPVFGLGTFEAVENTNESVLTFTRTLLPKPVDEDEDDDARGETVLCVNNLSARPQGATITLPEMYAGSRVRDVFGGSGFPRVGPDGLLTLTIGSRSFYWLSLVRPDPSAPDAATAALPILAVPPAPAEPAPAEPAPAKPVPAEPAPAPAGPPPAAPPSTEPAPADGPSVYDIPTAALRIIAPEPAGVPDEPTAAPAADTAPKRAKSRARARKPDADPDHGGDPS